MLRIFTALCIVVFCTSCQKQPNNEIVVSEELVMEDTLDYAQEKSDLHVVRSSCIEAVFEIIMSSEHYSNRIESSTIYGWRVHTSPNPVVDQAEVKGDFYEVILFEEINGNKNELETYRFSRHQKLLYVRDDISGEFEEIVFENSLLKDFELFCKMN